jgi:hypothetical protein
MAVINITCNFGLLSWIICIFLVSHCHLWGTLFYKERCFYVLWEIHWSIHWDMSWLISHNQTSFGKEWLECGLWSVSALLHSSYHFEPNIHGTIFRSIVDKAGRQPSWQLKVEGEWILSRRSLCIWECVHNRLRIHYYIFASVLLAMIVMSSSFISYPFCLFYSIDLELKDSSWILLF